MTFAIVLAAGKGRRAGTEIPKQFLEYEGEPLLLRSLRVFEKNGRVDGIIVVTGEDYISYVTKMIRDAGIGKVAAVVAGGKERSDSVQAGLTVAGEADKVLIHDGARPFLSGELLDRVIDALDDHDAVIPVIPVKDTVKEIDAEGYVVNTPRREHLRAVQTPQGFALPVLHKSYEMLKGELDGVTDDAMVVEKSGLARVFTVEGDPENEKVTTPEDIKRIGLG